MVGTVVPSHHATYLRETLISLLSQTVAHDLIVVDDASAGGETRRVARQLGVRCIRATSRIGASDARNLGIEELDTPWILNFDHDNVAEPRLIERLLASARRRPRIGIAYCTPRQIGMAHGPHPGVRRGTPSELAGGNFIDANSLFSTAAWREAGGWDGGAGIYADWDLWLGIVERGWGLAYVPEMLYRYRIHETGMLQSVDSPSTESFERYVRAKHGVVEGRPVPARGSGG